MYVDNVGLIGTTVSSEKYKENIVNITSASRIYDLQPIQFDWKDEDVSDFGLSAEYTEEVYPELVRYKSEYTYEEYDEPTLDGDKTVKVNRTTGYRLTDEPEGVYYEKLPTLLLVEIQNLNDRVKFLEENCVLK